MEERKLKLAYAAHSEHRGNDQLMKISKIKNNREATLIHASHARKP